MSIFDRPWARMRRMLHIWFHHYLRGRKPRFPRTVDYWVKVNGVNWPTLLKCECGKRF